MSEDFRKALDVHQAEKAVDEHIRKKTLMDEIEKKANQGIMVEFTDEMETLGLREWFMNLMFSREMVYRLKNILDKDDD